MFYAFFVIYTFRKIIQRGIKTMKKLKNKSKKIMMAAVIGLSLLFSSCSFFQHAQIKTEITDISKDTGFSEIVTQGYMGGSLIYNDKNVSLGQLAEGVCAGIRLSKAESKEVGNGQTVFKEIDNSAQYGLLQIEEIDNKKISFGIKIYDSDGTSYTEKHFILAENEQVDVNDDGLMDLEYKEPLRKRNGFEKSMYLNFLSSQQDLNITMFAVLKEQYPDENYPNGIIGINNDGRFIIQKYCDSENTQRSVVRGAYQGDYVLDTENGTYKRIKSNSYSRNARAIDDCDLETIDEQLITDAFYFTEEDFAFYSTDELIAALPTEITSKYTETGIEKLNRILEDRELIPAIAASQDSILTDEQKEEITSQFDLLTAEEIVQVNRVFLEQNYTYICPQRVTVAQAITEILPLASVVFTEQNVQENYDDELNDLYNNENSSRAASASFTAAKTKSDYLNKLKKIEKIFDEDYTEVYSHDLAFPISNQSSKEKPGIVTSTVKVKDSKFAVGITGSFKSVWGNVQSSLGAAVFLKTSAGVNVNIQRFDETVSNTSNTKLNKTTTLYEHSWKLYEKDDGISLKILRFNIGPIIIGLNINLNVGIPMNLNIKLDGDISYDAYIAGIAQANIFAGMDYGIEWRKKWIFKVPCPYTDFNSKASASADAIYYVDTNFESLTGELNALTVGFSVNPYIKAGIEASIAEVVHGGISASMGLEGYTDFGIEKKHLIGRYGLDEVNKIQANLFLGLKNLKVLGISIGDIGKNWDWDLAEYRCTIIPKTKFYDKELN